MDRRRFLVTVGGWVGVAACNQLPPLANVHDSPTELAAAILVALANNDRARLDALALNEQEFRDHVWPELPAARPERNLPFSYVWGDLRQKSEVSLAATLKEHAGHRYSLETVMFAGETQYLTYTVHRDATLQVNDASGNPVSLRVCGSMIEKAGAWKVFSYVVD
jgi:hypothetical protein